MNATTERTDAEDTRLIGMGRPPRNTREALRKLVWIGIWLAFMGAPLDDLLHGHHSEAATAWGWAGLGLFVATYLALVFRHTARPMDHRVTSAVLGALAVCSVVLTLALGEPWLVLFVYVSVAIGAVAPTAWAWWLIPGTGLVLLLLGQHYDRGFDLDLLVPCLLGGFAMTGVRQLVRTTVELREARATVAQLAANEERLRLARDLHDLLGHSLSLITLKSELAGRMLPEHPENAAKEVADIEQVSRQALVDVREAVTGYRRPRLLGELALVPGMLKAAGIEATVPADAEPTGLTEDAEAALAWALREAVTNVVRHSGARHCTVTLNRRETLDGPRVELAVEDDGQGTGSTVPGNGLTGMAERLEKVGGHLDAAPGKRRGFRMVARVPVER